MVHHTGSKGKVSDQESILWNGYVGLPGPLCHAGVDPAGILRLAGWGRANHAGLGDEQALRRVRSSTYPKIGNIKPGPAEVDGNVHFYGFEIMCDGKTPMSDAQRITSVRVAAMLCTEHKWGTDVIAHGEWQQGKWDPGANGKLIDMSKFRNEVDQAMKEGPKKKPLPTRPKTKLITVMQGDTLLGLAKKHYPNHGVDGWVEIVDDNPQLLQPGMKLTVPNN
jgi:hypothetical protein